MSNIEHDCEMRSSKCHLAHRRNKHALKSVCLRQFCTPSKEVYVFSAIAFISFLRNSVLHAPSRKLCLCQRKIIRAVPRYKEFLAIRRAISLMRRSFYFVEITTGETRHIQQTYIDEPSMHHCPQFLYLKRGFFHACNNSTYY